MAKRLLLGLSIISVLFLATAGITKAVTLDLGGAIGPQGGTVELTISLDTEGSAVTGTSNDITYDASLLSNPRARVDSSIGIDTQAGKQVIYNVVKEGLLRVGVFGLNREAIPDGVVAWVIFDVAKDAPAGKVIELENQPSTTDADGNALATSGSSGGVYVTRSSGGSAVSAAPSDSTPVSISISPASGEIRGPINLIIKVSEAETIQNFMTDGFSVFLNGEDITTFLLDSGLITIDEEKREATVTVQGLALSEGDYEINAYLGNLSGYIGHASAKYSVLSN